MKNPTKVQLARYGILALAGLSCESAKAGVVTSSSQGFVPLTIGLGQSGSVDLGNGANSVFNFAGLASFVYSSNASFVIQNNGAIPGLNQQVLALTGVNDPNRLGLNYVISAGRPWANAGNSTTNDIAGGTGGNWNGAGTVNGFLGIRFKQSALTSDYNYGYFDISYDNTPTSDNGTLTIRGWAYETNAGQAITTPAPVAPEPSSLMLAGLGMLSCGAAGLRALRAQTKSIASPASLDA
ncbi:MAG: PEP-CTERM sorting domain-containing protein [Cytophagales bacterium]|nr:PEP-CTERM sorting domain-containing protein [Armatimonadota bacterium]